MKKILVFTVIVLALVLTACGSSAPTAGRFNPLAALATPTDAPAPEPVEVAGSIPDVKIDAADYSFTVPETISAGWVRIILTNSGAEPHHIQFLRLNDGVTANQFMEALNQDIGPALAMVKEVGGVAPIHPGGSASAVLNLPVGDYVVLCFIPSPSDETPHVAKGMFKSLKVEAGASVAAEPSADLIVHLKDFLFDMPDSLPAGALTVEVINDGPESHEFNIHRLEDGKTANDVLEFLNGAGGPPPFTPVGGLNGLGTGLKGYAELNLEPGTYIAICMIPSPKAEGHPHFTLGMIKQFTVGSAASSNFPTGKFIKSGTTDYGFIFNEDGTYTRFETNIAATRGTYSVDGNVFTETSNDGGCASNISHTFTFDGKNLTFNYVGNPQDDTCGGGGRRADFDNVTYTLSEEASFPSGKFIQSGKTDYGLLFNADGTFSVFEGDKTFVHATYTVEGNVFTETSNDGGCETNESFTYTFDGTNLTFNYVGNPDDDTACAGRHADFNNVTYVLSE